MMRWLIDAMWGFCRLLGNALQLAGLLGLTAAGGIALWRLAGRLTEEGEEVRG